MIIPPTLATSLLPLLPTTTPNPLSQRNESSPTISTDVIVIGGGFSGLTSASTLHAAGLNTIVLEAAPQIGGRSRSQHRKSGPGVIELGATWINQLTQPDVFALTERFGLQTAEQYTEGDQVFELGGGRVRRVAQENASWSDDPELAELEGKMNLLIHTAANSTDIRNFTAFPKEQDISFAAWLGQHGLWDHELVRGAASSLSSILVGREPREVGAHYLLDYIQSGGGLVSLASEGQYGAQSLKVVNGTTAIATALADSLPKGSVYTNTPVTSITQENNGTSYTIHTKCGRTFRSRNVILAIPTNTYNLITFSPPLPPAKQTLASNTKPGVYAKMILSYTSPWWRTAGLVGKFSSMTGPICFSWDTSSPSDSQYSLAIFIAGDIARTWGALPSSEKETSVIEHLATLVGEELAGKAREVLEVNYVEWTVEEYLGGAPTSAIGAGFLREYGEVLRQRVGGMYFAGAETAYEWKGYLEGAVRAGERAAREVVAGLRGGGGGVGLRRCLGRSFGGRMEVSF